MYLSQFDYDVLSTIDIIDRVTTPFIVVRGYKVYQNEGGGNCFVYALQDQLQLINHSNQSDTVQQFRNLAVEYLRKNWDQFSNEQWSGVIDEHRDTSLAMADEYLQQLSQKLWFDAISIMALARSLGIVIMITTFNGQVMQYGDDDVISSADNTVYVYYHNNHYCSMHPLACPCLKCIS